MEGRGHDLISDNYPGICLKQLNKTTKKPQSGQMDSVQIFEPRIFQI